MRVLQDNSSYGMPDCRICGDNRQVWRNQISGKLKCHRAYCETEVPMEDLLEAFIQLQKKLAATEADRAQRVPDDFLSHRSAWRAAMVIAEGFAANGDDASYWRHELKAFDNAYSMLASTPAPAHVASRHAMSDFEVTKSIIHGCPALRLPQSFLQRLGMTAQIVALKGATPEIAEFIAAACNKLTDHFAGTHSPAPAQQDRKPMTYEQRRALIDAAGDKTDGLTQDDFADEIVRSVERHHGIRKD